MGIFPRRKTKAVRLKCFEVKGFSSEIDSRIAFFFCELPLYHNDFHMQQHLVIHHVLTEAGEKFP